MQQIRQLNQEEVGVLTFGAAQKHIDQILEAVEQGSLGPSEGLVQYLSCSEQVFASPISIALIRLLKRETVPGHLLHLLVDVLFVFLSRWNTQPGFEELAKINREEADERAVHRVTLTAALGHLKGVYPEEHLITKVPEISREDFLKYVYYLAHTTPIDEEVGVYNAQTMFLLAAEYGLDRTLNLLFSYWATAYKRCLEKSIDMTYAYEIPVNVLSWIFSDEALVQELREKMRELLPEVPDAFDTVLETFQKFEYWDPSEYTTGRVMNIIETVSLLKTYSDSGNREKFRYELSDSLIGVALTRVGDTGLAEKLSLFDFQLCSIFGDEEEEYDEDSESSEDY